MNKRFTKILALFLALIMAVPFGAFGTLGIFAETESVESEQTEEEVFTFPTLTNTEKVVYFGANTGGSAPDGLTPTSSFTTASSTKTAVANGGTVVLSSKGHVGGDFTFSANSTVVITGKDTDGTYYYDVESPNLKNDGGQGQWGMFMVLGGKTFTIESELIFKETIILERNSTPSTYAVADGGVLMIEDSVRFMIGQDSVGVPIAGASTTKIVVNAGGVAIFKAGGFSSCSGAGTVYVDKDLIGNGIEASKFSGFTGKLLDLDGNPLCSVTGNHSNVVELKDHKYYNKCSSCGETSVYSYTEPVLTNTTDEYFWAHSGTDFNVEGKTTLATANLVSAVNNGGTVYLVQKGYYGKNYTLDFGGTTKITAVYNGEDYRDKKAEYGAIMWDSDLIFTFVDDVIFEKVNILSRRSPAHILQIANGATALFDEVKFNTASGKVSTVLDIAGGSTAIIKGNCSGDISSVTGTGTLIIDMAVVKSGLIKSSAVENFEGCIMTLDCKEVCAFTGGHSYVDNVCEICGTEKGTVTTKIYVKADGTGDGLTPENPTNSLRQGFSYASADPIEIILVDDLTIGGFIRCDGNTQDVKVTSMDLDGDGVYPKLIIQSWIILQNSGAGNTITFENIEIQSDRSGTVPIFANYNNLTIGKGVTCTISEAHKEDGLYPTIYAGFLESEGENTAEDKSNDYNTTINVASGTWSSIFGGNRRATLENAIGNNRADMTINVSGGTIVGTEGRGAITGTGYNFYSGDVSINVTGGVINGNIYGVGYLGQYGGATPYDEYGLKGDIAISINGGTITGDIYAKYLYSAIAPLIRGNVSVEIGEFADLSEGVLVDLRSTVAYSGQSQKSSLDFDEIHTEYLTTKFIDTINGIATDDGEPARIAFVGDSITQGTGASDRTVYSYPAQLQAMIDADKYMIGNFGVGAAGALPSTGYYYNDTLQYHLLMEEFEPHTISFALGTNDSLSAGGVWGVAVNFENEYYNLIKNAADIDGVEKIYVATPLLRLDSPSRQSRNVSIIEPAVRSIVAKLQALGYDATVFELNANTYTDVLAGNVLGNDNLHPGDAGYTIMANAFHNALFNGIVDVPQGYYVDTMYVSDNGTLTGVGTIDDPTTHYEVALSRISKTGGKLVILDTYTIQADVVTPVDITGVLTIEGATSEAVLNWGGNTFKLGCDTVFDNFTLNTISNTPYIIGWFNDVTFEDGFKSVASGDYQLGFVAEYFVYEDMSLTDTSEKTTYDTVESASSSNDIIITFKGGTFGLIALGNRRMSPQAPVGNYSGNMTVNLLGGTISGVCESTFASGALTMMNLSGSMVVNFDGMDVQGTFYGVTRTATLTGVKYDSALNTGSIVINAPANVLDHYVENQNYSQTQLATIEKLTVVCTTAAGDIDIDGVISNSDITAIVRYLSGWDVAGAKYTADYNADEKINNRDAIALVQKLSGWTD